MFRMDKECLNVDWRFRTPARIELTGPSQSGKSETVLKLIKDASVWDREFKYVIYCAPLINQNDKLCTELADACIGKKLLLLDKVPSFDDINRFRNNQHCLLAMDDIALFEDGDNTYEFMQKLVLLHSHHNSISLIYCIQNPYLQSKKKIDLVSISRNLTVRIVLYQINDYYIYNLMSSRIFPGHRHFLTHCLERAKEQYNLNYVVVNVNAFSNMPRRYICYSGIFEEERKKHFDSPIFFDLDNYSVRTKKK